MPPVAQSRHSVNARCAIAPLNGGRRACAAPCLAPAPAACPCSGVQAYASVAPKHLSCSALHTVPPACRRPTGAAAGRWCSTAARRCGGRARGRPTASLSVQCRRRAHRAGKRSPLGPAPGPHKQPWGPQSTFLFCTTYHIHRCPRTLRWSRLAPPPCTAPPARRPSSAPARSPPSVGARRGGRGPRPRRPLCLRACSSRAECLQAGSAISPPGGHMYAVAGQAVRLG